MLTKEIKNLAKKIAAHYNELSLEEAQVIVEKGMMSGLKAYKANNRTDNLMTYLSWFGKTAIENELGYDNEDTKTWKNMLK